MAVDQAGIMALPENQAMAAPQLSMQDSYGAMREALQEARPDADLEMQEALDEIKAEISEISDENLGELISAIQSLYDNPQTYTQEVAELVADGDLDADDLPAEYDEEFLSAMLMVLVDEQRSRETAGMPQGIAGMVPPPQQFARGGIAEAARIVANQGRRGDTMLAHITPSEARMLRSRGGSGTINPQTGLPEFFIKKLFKSVKKVVKSVGKAVKKVLESPVGRIVATVALGAVLGPAVMTVFPSLGAVTAAGTMGLTAAGSAVVGGLSSGIVTAAAGGSLKDVLKASALGAFSAPGGPVSNYIGKYTGQFISNPVVREAANAAIIGTAGGALTGQSLKDSLKSGLTQGVISGGVALASGANSQQVKETAAKSAADAVDEVAAQSTTPVSDPVAAQQAALAKGTLGQVDDAAMAQLDDLATQKAIQDFRGPTNVRGGAAQQNAFPSRSTDVLPDGRVVTMTGSAIDNIAAPSDLARSFEASRAAQGSPFASSPQSNLLSPQVQAAQQASTLSPSLTTAAPSQFGMNAPFPGTTPVPGMPSAVQAQTAGAGTATNIPIPDYTATGQLLPSADYAGGIQLQEGIDIPYGGSTGATASAPAYTPGGPGVMDSLGKMGTGAKGLLTGDFKQGASTLMEGAGDLFAPGPSQQQLVDYAAANRISIDEASKRISPGFMRTYGPATAAGVGALALAGGFTPKMPKETEQQREFRERMMGPIDLSTDPRSYYTQNLPGVEYNERGEIIGSKPWSPTATMADIQGPSGYSYVPYSNPFEQPQYRNMGGLMEAQNATRQPSYEFLGTPQYMNTGGIAALASGGYPRKVGQIQGPGTEKSDSIPAMLSDGEFVMTAKAVRGAGGGSRREGAKRMYALMHRLERNAARG